jgi:pimeloyl-ACP methyl ester carboxylesterase
MKLIQIVTFLLLVVNINLQAQDIPYGVNEKAGHYCNVGDAKIYYEVYGEGKPIVLLHGGFGYIDGFKKYIPVFSKKYKVIAVATRGYGKSEIGNKKFSYGLLADDVKKVIEKECQGKAIIIGSSDGAMVAYVVASNYPEAVSKVVAMGGSLGTSGYSKEGLDWLKNFNSEELESYRPDFKKIMPQPERWADLTENLRLMWSTEHILQFDELKKIGCPMLLLYGDRDLYCTMGQIANIYQSIPNAQLAVIPNSSHTDVSFRNSKILEDYILPFIDNQ